MASDAPTFAVPPGFLGIGRREHDAAISIAGIQHLMLRQDVTEACAAGRFAVYPIATINEGIALLTGLAAGTRQDDGTYPLHSVNRRVEDRLRAFASIRRDFANQGNSGRVAGN